MSFQHFNHIRQEIKTIKMKDRASKILATKMCFQNHAPTIHECSLEEEAKTIEAKILSAPNFYAGMKLQICEQDVLDVYATVREANYYGFKNTFIDGLDFVVHFEYFHKVAVSAPN